jgi:hypothetical protein
MEEMLCQHFVDTVDSLLAACGLASVYLVQTKIKNLFSIFL